MVENMDDATYTASIPMGRKPGTKAPSKATKCDLRAAYLATNYSFVADGMTHMLKVGTQSKDVAALIKSLGTKGAALVTAYNPASLQLGQVHNRLATAALNRDLKNLKRVDHVHIFPALGQALDGSWPAEPSIMIVGINRQAAEVLGRRYGQYAILWIGEDGVPQLVELTDLDKGSRHRVKNPPFKSVEIGVAWSDEWVDLQMTPGTWRRILAGEHIDLTSRAGYDGEMFTLTWTFTNGTELYVSYGDDGGTAFDGRLQHVTLTLAAD